MSISLVYKDKYLFHIVHIKNLPGIFTKGILCRNLIKSKRIKYEDISSNDIQAMRGVINIPTTKHTLHNYVPLFFGARPPMLYAIRSRGIVQEDIIYILVDWNVINKSNTWFTDGNARSSNTNFFQGIANLSKVDFKAADSIYWGADKGEEFKRKKQAEVLVLEQILMDEIKGFVVYNKSAKEEVTRLLGARKITDKAIFIVPKFYY